MVTFSSRHVAARVRALRLEEAKQMLEASALPIEAIANEVGYEDAAFYEPSCRFRLLIG